MNYIVRMLKLLQWGIMIFIVLMSAHRVGYSNACQRVHHALVVQSTKDYPTTKGAMQISAAWIKMHERRVNEETITILIYLVILLVVIYCVQSLIRK